MAGNMAWKAGKGAFQKFNGKNSQHDPSIMNVDHSHYRGAKVTKEKVDGQLEVYANGKIANNHRKDTAYYMYMGIPEKDARTLSRVVKRARRLDNGIRVPFIGWKIGVNSIVGVIPEAGDFVGGTLSFVLIVLPASRISNRSDHDAKKLKRTLWRNWVIGFSVGLMPLFGDLFDSVAKFNVKSADALEKMLLDRVKDAAKMGLDAEKVGRKTRNQHAVTNGHHLAATNGYHDTEPPNHPARRFVGTNDLRHDSRPAATAQAPVVQTQSKKSGGSFFRRRVGPQGGREVRPTAEEVAPSRPPRPNHSHNQRDGHF